MNSKIIIAIIVIAIILFGGFFLLSSDGTENLENVDVESADLTMEVPAIPGNGVDEMIVNEDPQLEGDGDGMTTDEVMDLAEDTSAPKIVTYTDSGFSPETITISAGETVTFVNNSSRGMWVASDIHPTHTLYPEKTDADCLGSSFDACEKTPVGESWSFTFNKEGSWKYHDHARASRTGIVVVE